MQSAVTVPYAVEFRDLSDNAALLGEVAQMTGGRLVKSDPTQADIFAEAGVKFPETASPLTKPLILVWLAIFLLEFAIRRIALDVRAVARRVSSLITRIRPGVSGLGTLDRLRLQQAKLRQRMASGVKTAHAQKRFEASQEPSESLPVSEISAKSETPSTETQETAQEDTQQEQEMSHLQQLLKVKRKHEHRSSDSPNQSGDK